MDCIFLAAEELIRKNGFSNILVTDIIKQAKIEPIVFYNRFPNLDSFLNEFVKHYDYWFSDILKKIKNPFLSKQGLIEIFQQLLLELNNDSIMLELLRWEVANGNNTTNRTAMLREIHITPLVKEFEKEFNHKGIDIAALTAIIIGGLYYLSLHKDRSTFSNIDINTKEGFSRILNSIAFFVNKIYDDNNIENEKKLIEQRLKEAGINDNIIQQCVWTN